jgi:flavin-dependent dehydrogenase
MIDAIVSGAGPAGSIAALVLARAGARVWLLERETFPRPKLCGDTINPGAVATLADLGLTGGPLIGASRLTGMLVTSPHTSVTGLYPEGQVALALSRAVFDQWLADAAVAAGARLEYGVRVLQPLWQDNGIVAGVVVRTPRGETMRLPARMTIAADGRRSVLARAAKLSWHPASPRRWAFGVYATDVGDMTTLGEMHVRPGSYVGLAPLGNGVTNVCAVTGPRPGGRTPIDVIRRALDADERLRARSSGWRPIGAPQVLGPLAVDTDRVGVPGLLLAGDAAGFVDPMTGDGLHLAIRGGVLAAAATLEALEADALGDAVHRLAASRRTALGAKLRFDRWMRQIVSSSAAMTMAGIGAQVAPGVLRRIVRYAGDAA